MFINGQVISVGSPTQTPAQQFIFEGALVAATSTAVGGVVKVKNDLGIDLIVTGVIVDTTTKSTGAATVDAGIDDGGDVSSDNLLDGLDVGTAAGFFSNSDNAGTNGNQKKLWKKDEYFVATASATVAGLVGKYKIFAIAR